jgi:hypothetical protein
MAMVACLGCGVAFSGLIRGGMDESHWCDECWDENKVVWECECGWSGDFHDIGMDIVYPDTTGMSDEQIMDAGGDIEEILVCSKCGGRDTIGIRGGC